jgi:hypothetical protein
MKENYKTIRELTLHYRATLISVAFINNHMSFLKLWKIDQNICAHINFSKNITHSNFSRLVSEIFLNPINDLSNHHFQSLKH